MDSLNEARALRATPPTGLCEECGGTPLSMKSLRFCEKCRLALKYSLHFVSSPEDSALSHDRSYHGYRSDES